MDSRVKSKSKKSLCENSMKVVANVVRLSSFSIAQKTLGTATAGKTAKDLSGSDYSDMEDPEKQSLVPDQFPESRRRSQEPQSRKNPTYVTNPPVEKVDEVKPKKEEGAGVDGLASKYIREIRDNLKLERGKRHESLLLGVTKVT